jgi:nucleoside 2-deoxyribosyltransferase
MRTAGQILEQIWGQLRRAETVVADLTHSNPNVYYEVGLAHALGKQIIFITQDRDQLPFDVSTSRCVRYDKTDTDYLRVELEGAFTAVPQRYKFDRTPSA